MTPVIYPYKMASISARLLADALECKRIFPDRKYKYKKDHLIINWGNSTMPVWDYDHMLNKPFYVKLASNKLTTFYMLGKDNIPTPRYATNKGDAEKLFDTSRRVYCRKTLTGHSGYGIIIASTPEELVDAPLYTEGIDGKRKEYRVHVFGDSIIDIQQKKKKVGADAYSMVRNHDNGWIYAREGVDIPDETREAAIKAVRCLGLDFGAVDVVVRDVRDTEPFILEVNTACGLEGTTLQSYVQAIKEVM